MHQASTPLEPRPSFLARARAWVRDEPDQAYPWMVLIALTAVLIWGYWNSLCVTAKVWNNPIYSHGYLVPVFAVVLLWLRWERLTPVAPLARWAGLALLTAGLSMRVLATYYSNNFGELVSFVPSLAGLVLLVGGWSMFRWAGPAVAFLIFMFPLPSQVKEHLLLNLQHLATVASTFALQTLGIAAYYEGNRITVGEMQMGVVEACSGLRMSTNLLALAVAVALVARRPWWDRVIILLSAIPIALAVNVVRITATGIFHYWTSDSGLVNEQFHDWAGLAMMPLALGLLFLEINILSRLVVEEDDAAVSPLRVGMRTTAPKT